MKIMNPHLLLKAALTVIFNLMFDHKLAIPGQQVNHSRHSQTIPLFMSNKFLTTITNTIV